MCTADKINSAQEQAVYDSGCIFYVLKQNAWPVDVT